MIHRLLILDDDRLVGETICAVADFCGAEARTAKNYEDFVRLLDEWAPTHVVIDLVMPRVDGVEVLRMLADRHCGARIILTGGAGERVLDAARRVAIARGLTIAGILPKPFGLGHLHALLAPCAEDEQERPSGVLRETVPISEESLRRAIEQDEIVVYYQPKILCGSREVVGFEALARWRRPTTGLVPPGEFIHLAEETGLIVPLTERVLDRSLSWFALAVPPGALSLALNISPNTLHNVDFADRLERTCRDHDVSPDRIVIEITESVALADGPAALDILTRLRLKGVHLSMDDFGVGYSSILQVSRFPFSSLKIDKSFVMTAVDSRELRALVGSIVTLGHSLGLTLTAEGVETLATLEFLEEVGCDEAQGHLMAPPLPEDQVGPWLASLGNAPWSLSSGGLRDSETTVHDDEVEERAIGSRAPGGV